MIGKTTAQNLFKVVLLSALATSSAAANDFYEGKTLEVIVNYGAGGNTDITARTLMNFMREHIPGKPRIVVKNKPGAGGIVGTNFFAKAAKKDGTSIGVFSVALMPEIMKDKALTASHRDFVFIGGIPEDTVFHARKGAGLEKATDIFDLKTPIKTAGHGPANMKDLMLRSAMDLLGVQYQHVTGYKSSGKVRGAILKNDVDMTADSMTGYASRVKPNLVDKDHSIPLFSLGFPTDDGHLATAPGSLEGVPTFDEFYKSKFGKLPAGPEYDVLRTVAKVRSTSLRAVFLPKGSPPEAVEALRAAFDATSSDPKYRAEFLKVSGFDLVALPGAQAEQRLDSLLKTSPETLEFLKTYAEKGSQ